jgi:hypothetical protein
MSEILVLRAQTSLFPSETDQTLEFTSGIYGFIFPHAFWTIQKPIQ